VNTNTTWLEMGAAPTSEDQLEERLTRPAPELIDTLRRLEGDMLVLGAGGKMGPSLAVLARWALEEAGSASRVYAVSRFGSGDAAARLREQGVETIACDLLEREALQKLPDAPNVIFLAGMKFGSTGSPAATWAMNVLLPAMVAERFRGSRIVALSTGNVYPFTPVASGGATEETRPEPVGEYAQSCLGRERMFEYGSDKWGTRAALIRLNYANDLRYGVLLDVAEKVHNGLPVDVTMGHVNTIWQGDANSIVLRCLDRCAAPPYILNLTGAEIISVRDLAQRFGRLLGREVEITGTEAETALLSNAEKCRREFGPPSVPLDTMIEWTAQWVRSGGPTLRKPTHFETRDGKF
jgi:nucleoside-diphosphate-sugar epimerase